MAISRETVEDLRKILKPNNRRKGWIAGVLAALLVASVSWVGRGLIQAGQIETRLQSVENLSGRVDALARDFGTFETQLRGLEKLAERVDILTRDFAKHLSHYDDHRVNSGEVIADYRGRMDRVEADILVARQWRDDWQDHGMLKWDVKQNEQIIELRADLLELHRDVERLGQ